MKRRTLSPEEAGIEVALKSHRQGRVIDTKRAREIIDGRSRAALKTSYTEGAIAIGDVPHSLRSVLIGAIMTARAAGIMAATNAHPASDPAATVRAMGSQ